MKPAPFVHLRPHDLAEALNALAETPDAKVLAGGQSLVPLLSMRLAAPAALVDINRLPDLDHVTASDDGVRIGALARHTRVLSDPDARRVQPLLAAALALVAHPTIRNRGTTVGSIVHADAAAEMPAVLSLLQGSVRVASVRGERTIAADDLFVGPLESSLAADELAVEAFFPALGEGEGVACDEVARRHGDYALCGVAALVRVDDQGQVAGARAAYWSMAEVPTTVDLTDQLAGATTADGGLEAEALDAAAEHALGRLDPEGDIHGSAAYREQLTRALTRRVLTAAHEDARSRATTGPTTGATTGPTTGGPTEAEGGPR